MRQKAKMDAPDVAQCLSNAKKSSETAVSIRSNFYSTGIWDLELLKPNSAPLEKH